MMDTEYTEPNYTFEVTTMIIDKTSNLELYKSLIPHLDVILNFARTAAEKPVGTYPYPGGRIMIQEGETRALEGAEFESHKNFLDLQWILEGKEMMEYANIHDLTKAFPINAEKDIQFWQGKGVSWRFLPVLSIWFIRKTATNPAVIRRKRILIGKWLSRSLYEFFQKNGNCLEKNPPI